MDKIILISTQARQPLDSDPFVYYENLREKDPLLFELAITVLAAPATQVSVERAMNALKLLLSSSRYNLKKETIEDVLFINLNQDLIKYVNFESM